MKEKMERIRNGIKTLSYSNNAVGPEVISQSPETISDSIGKLHDFTPIHESK